MPLAHRSACCWSKSRHSHRQKSWRLVAWGSHPTRETQVLVASNSNFTQPQKEKLEVENLNLLSMLTRFTYIHLLLIHLTYAGTSYKPQDVGWNECQGHIHPLLQFVKYDLEHNLSDERTLFAALLQSNITPFYYRASDHVPCAVANAANAFHDVNVNLVRSEETSCLDSLKVVLGWLTVTNLQ